MTIDDIRAKLKENRDAIKKYGVMEIGIFGSHARGEARDDSDLDMIVVFERGKKTFDNFMDLHEMLERMYNRKIELVTLESISTYIRPYVEEEVVYERL